MPVRLPPGRDSFDLEGDDVRAPEREQPADRAREREALRPPHHRLREVETARHLREGRRQKLFRRLSRDGDRRSGVGSALGLDLPQVLDRESPPAREALRRAGRLPVRVERRLPRRSGHFLGAILLGDGESLDEQDEPAGGGMRLDVPSREPVLPEKLLRFVSQLARGRGQVARGNLLGTDLVDEIPFPQLRLSWSM